jgi:hypothetical protein
MVEQGPSTAVKIGAAITAGALVAGGGAVLAYESGIFDSGASSHTQTIPTPEQPTIIPGTSVIRTATPEATAIPTPKPGFIENAGAFTYRTESGEVLSVPQIDGLIAKLVKVRDTNEVQYFAKEGNPYGIEANGHAGEYNPNVFFMEAKRTGGVVLDARVTKNLIAQHTDFAQFPLPLDVGAEKTTYITVGEYSANPKYPAVKVYAGGENMLVNIFPNSKEILFNKTVNSQSYVSYSPYPVAINMPNESELLQYTNVGFKESRDKSSVALSSFGDAIKSVIGTVEVGFGLRTDEQIQAHPINDQRVLTVRGVPVFQAANPPK